MAAHNAGFCCQVPGACGCGLYALAMVVAHAMKTFSGSDGRGCSPRRPMLWSVAATAGLGRMPRRGPGLWKHAGLGLPLVGSGEPRFAEGVTGHGRFDVLVAGQAFQRDRLVHGE